MTNWINGVLITLAMLITAVTVTLVAMIFEPRPQPVRLDLGTITTTVPCPTEDSCTADYRDGAWHIERTEP